MGLTCGARTRTGFCDQSVTPGAALCRAGHVPVRRAASLAGAGPSVPPARGAPLERVRLEWVPTGPHCDRVFTRHGYTSRSAAAEAARSLRYTFDVDVLRLRGKDLSRHVRDLERLEVDLGRHPAACGCAGPAYDEFRASVVESVEVWLRGSSGLLMEGDATVSYCENASQFLHHVGLNEFRHTVVSLDPSGTGTVSGRYAVTLVRVPPEFEHVTGVVFTDDLYAALDLPWEDALRCLKRFDAGRGDHPEVFFEACVTTASLTDEEHEEYVRLTGAAWKSFSVLGCLETEELRRVLQDALRLDEAAREILTSLFADSVRAGSWHRRSMDDLIETARLLAR